MVEVEVESVEKLARNIKKKTHYNNIETEIM